MESVSEAPTGPHDYAAVNVVWAGLLTALRAKANAMQSGAQAVESRARRIQAVEQSPAPASCAG